MPSTINGSYPNGVTISNAAAANPVTITAASVLGNPGGAALLGTGTTPDWTIANAGTIRSTGTTTGANGILLSGGGTITNQAAGLIGGVYAGIATYAAGTVINGGSIAASLTSKGRGVFLAGGGAVVNGTGAGITGAYTGVGITGVGTTGVGVVINSGSIAGTAGYGLALGGGGAVTNNASAAIVGYKIGVSLATIGSVTNMGSIASGRTTGLGIALDTVASLITPLTGAVVLSAGGGVSNASTGVITSTFLGVALTAGGSLNNAGQIAGTSTAGGYGVVIQGGASLVNAATGTITGGSDAVIGYGTLATSVINAGRLVSTARSGVELFTPGQVTNAASGTIVAPKYGVLLRKLGSLTNAGSIAALGSINTGTTAFGVFLAAGGYALNAAGGSIVSSNVGIETFNVAATAVNLGSISSTRTLAGAGIQLRAGGTVTNGAGGTITSRWIGVQIGGGASNGATFDPTIVSTINNAGFIAAYDPGSGSGASLWVRGPGVILNTGTIANGPYGIVEYAQTTITNQGSIGGSVWAIDPSSASFNDRVIVGPGARFSGVVGGSYTGRVARNATTGQNYIANPRTSSGTLQLQAGSGSIVGFDDVITTAFTSKYIGFSQVVLDPGAFWSLAGTVSNAQTLSFGGANAGLTLVNPASVAGTIANFAATDTIALSGLTDVTGATLNAGNLLSITRSAGPTLTLQFDPAQHFSGNRFGVAVAGGNTNLTVPCFAAGTRIRTSRGEIAVERLRVGDVAINRWNEALPIVWLGHRRIDCSGHVAPEAVLPIRVAADAFAPGQPARDLHLSPDHAVFLDGDLIPVRYLVNGLSIARIPLDQLENRQVEYWHVELPRHDVLLAENLACESYLDTDNRHAFAGGAVVQAHPDFAALAIWDAQACGRLVRGGPALAAARAQLLARLPAGALTEDPDLHILADGARIEPTGRAHDHHFVLPSAARLVLASRHAIPAETTVDNPDPRRLGVAVTALRLDGHMLPLDHPALVGWLAAEPGLRWTDGAASLPPCRHAVVTLAPLLRYPNAARLPARLPAQRRG